MYGSTPTCWCQRRTKSHNWQKVDPAPPPASRALGDVAGSDPAKAPCHPRLLHTSHRSPVANVAVQYFPPAQAYQWCCLRMVGRALYNNSKTNYQLTASCTHFSFENEQHSTCTHCPVCKGAEEGGGRAATHVLHSAGSCEPAGAPTCQAPRIHRVQVLQKVQGTTFEMIWNQESRSIPASRRELALALHGTTCARNNRPRAEGWST